MTEKSKEAMRRLGAPVPFPRRLTYTERYILWAARYWEPCDFVRWPNHSFRDRKSTVSKKIVRRFVRARSHLVQLKLLRIDRRGYYVTTCHPVARLR